jgi:putative membrane protein
MKKIVISSAFCAALLALMIACGGNGANTNVTVNRGNTNTGSTMGNAANSAGNAGSSVGNTISNAASSLTTPSPDTFMEDAAQGGMAEVELGKLASSKAQNPEVKKFGAMMVADHTKANAELKAIAAKKNFQLPTDLGSHKSDLDSMSKLSGAEFDQEYVDNMVDDHEDDVAAFQKMADSGTDPELKAFATKCLPVLKKHLEAIKAIQEKMNNKQ